MHGLGRPFVAEQPLMREGKVSQFNLQEWQDVIAMPGVSVVSFPQCPFGARATKWTTLVVFLVTTAGLPLECPHEARWWRFPSTGKWYYGSHPPLKGVGDTMRAVAAASWAFHIP